MPDRNIKIAFLAVAVFSTLVTSAADVSPAPFGDHVKLRGSLDNSRIQFESTRSGRVAFIGGSITEMNGYRPMVGELLQKRFPQTQFKFIDAGISSTTSTTGAFRLMRDVFSGDPVDLLFVEFAVNDDQDGHHTRQECVRGIEGIIRHARAMNPSIDIVMTYFVNEPMLKTLQDGKLPLTIEAHEAVAVHYGVPTIHLAAEVAEQITAGTLTWKQYGGVHPAPFGNAICTRMIDELFNRAWKMPATENAKIKPHAVPTKPLETGNYEHGRLISPSEAIVKSGWTLGIPDWKALPGGKRERFTKLSLLSADQAGAEASLNFEGSTIGAYVLAGPDAGIVEISLDQGDWSTVDLYHNYSKTLHYPRTVIFATDLVDGKHTLVMRVSADTHSAGHAARILEFVAN